MDLSIKDMSINVISLIISMILSNLFIFLIIYYKKNKNRYIN